MFTGFAVPNIVGGSGITLGTAAAQSGRRSRHVDADGRLRARRSPRSRSTVGVFALGVCAFTVLCQKLLKK